MFELQQHTADVRIALRSSSLQELFVDGLRGLNAVMRPVEGADASVVTFAFDVESGDATSLLVDFLSDVLVRMHVDHRRFDSLAFDQLTLTRAAGVAYGRGPVEFEEDVKAVTYHEAEVVQSSAGEWSTGIVLDL